MERMRGSAGGREIGKVERKWGQTRGLAQVFR